MKTSRDTVPELVLYAIVVTTAILIGFSLAIAFRTPPWLEPHSSSTKAGVVTRSFLAQRGGYKTGSTEHPHVVFRDINNGESFDIEVTFNEMANMNIGDTVHVEFCEYWQCWDHHYSDGAYSK
jgi:hypothetical protein